MNIKEVLHSNNLSGSKTWLYDSLKHVSENKFEELKPQVKAYMKSLDLDSSEISSKLYKVKKSLYK